MAPKRFRLDGSVAVRRYAPPHWPAITDTLRLGCPSRRGCVWRLNMGAWLRRIVVSIGIGGMSYLIMLGIMVLSVVYDRELEPVVTYAFDTGRRIIGALDTLVSGSHWGQVAVNHLRERVNMTHVVLSIPAIIVAVIIVGIPFNWLLGGARTAVQRIAIALLSVPATVVLAVT